MLDARAHGVVGPLPVTRKKCSEQIKLLEQQRKDIDRALAELRQIYVDMFGIAEAPRKADATPGGESSRAAARSGAAPSASQAAR